MPTIQACKLPRGALLGKYLQAGGYADCFVTDVARPVSQAEYVEAFYSTPLIRAERWLLGWLVAKPSTDAEVKALAAGTLDTFAAWHVEARSADQLLLADYRGHTRSWLMSSTGDAPGATTTTRLYFGSAVVPVVSRKSGTVRMGFAFRALLGFHKLYSRALLAAARSRLARRGPGAGPGSGQSASTSHRTLD